LHLLGNCTGERHRNNGSVKRRSAIAADPTTGKRLEDIETEFNRLFKPQLIIGKRGMGKKPVKL
jgi:tartrate dehydratase beta subunit/fumarate hydratase class I family protein